MMAQSDQERRPAAQYIRMSTDMQHLSITLQKTANQAFADRHGLKIVATYEDPGVSGVTIDKRPGLRRLISDAMAGTAEFRTILVFDVSRWGRFQDPDEAAHYEFLCRSAGFSVLYTAEGFENDQSLPTMLVKQLKRVMAAEFSRDLSRKIAAVHQHLHSQGYFSGGSAPYGYLREQVHPTTGERRLLIKGEQKSFAGCRIVLTPGPPEEVVIVRRIFRAFVVRQRTTAQIAAELNADPKTLRRGRPWRTGNVLAVLRNETYAGTAVRGKQRYYLNRCCGSAPPAAWRRRRNAYKAIVSRAIWNKAAGVLEMGRGSHVTEEVLIADLRKLFRRTGQLTARTIMGHGAYPLFVYRRTFGSLTEAYMRAGLAESRSECVTRLRRSRPRESYLRKPRVGTDLELLEKLQTVLKRNGRLSFHIIEETSDCPSISTYRDRFGCMRRAYALVGYQPSRYQDLQMTGRGQSISILDAARLRGLVVEQGIAAGLDSSAQRL